MTTLEILQWAAEGYGSDALGNAFDETGAPVTGTGDGLAEFLVQEIIENSCGDDSIDQLTSVLRALNRAGEELAGVIAQIADKLRESLCHR